jgi:hypothetical protein
VKAVFATNAHGFKKIKTMIRIISKHILLLSRFYLCASGAKPVFVFKARLDSALLRDFHGRLIYAPASTTFSALLILFITHLFSVNLHLLLHAKTADFRFLHLPFTVFFLT